MMTLPSNAPGEEPDPTPSETQWAPVPRDWHWRQYVPQLVTIEDAALALSMSVSSVRRLLHEGQLRPVRVSAHGVRVRCDDLAAFIERHTEETRPDADLPELDRDDGREGA